MASIVYETLDREVQTLFRETHFGTLQDIKSKLKIINLTFLDDQKWRVQ